MPALKLVPPVADRTRPTAPPAPGPASGVRDIRTLLTVCETCRIKDASTPLCPECIDRQRVAEFMNPAPAEPTPELCGDCRRKSCFDSLCPECEAAVCHAQVLNLVRKHPAKLA